jgi:hypothetical protein
MYFSLMYALGRPGIYGSMRPERTANGTRGELWGHEGYRLRLQAEVITALKPGHGWPPSNWSDRPRRDGPTVANRCSGVVVAPSVQVEAAGLAGRTVERVAGGHAGLEDQLSGGGVDDIEHVIGALSVVDPPARLADDQPPVPGGRRAGGLVLEVPPGSGQGCGRCRRYRNRGGTVWLAVWPVVVTTLTVNV